MVDFIKSVRNANTTRSVSRMERRMLKLGEEFGEAAQAYLSVTSENNSKEKTWADVREELTDVIIVALDILLTKMPDEDFKEKDENKEIDNRIKNELIRKLEKWNNKLKKQSKHDDSE